MRHLFIIVLSFVCFSTTQAQDYPLPDFVNSFYLVTPNGLLNLEKQEASTKTKLNAASFVTVFATGTKSSAIVKLSKSPVRTKGKITIIYEPSVMADPASALKVIPLNSNEEKDIRWVETGRSSLFRAKNNDLEVIPFTYKKYKEKYLIIEIEKLQPGEYAILFSSTNQFTGNLQYQLFGVDQ